MKFNFLSSKNARIIGGGAAAALAVMRVIPAEGQAFKLPGFSSEDLWGFWLPAATAAVAFMPGLVPQSKRLTGVGLLVIGGRRLWQGATAPTLSNAVFSYSTALTGFTLAA